MQVLRLLRAYQLTVEGSHDATSGYVPNPIYFHLYLIK